MIRSFPFSVACGLAVLLSAADDRSPARDPSFE
jgi:hypothetical protein